MEINKKYVIGAINNIDRRELDRQTKICLECDKLYTCDNNYDQERVEQCIKEKEV